MDPNPESLPTSGGVRRILVVEDVDWMAHFLSGIIRDTPSLELVGTATSAEEARPLIHRLAPDAIILDVCLPGRGGLEFCREIKAQQNPPRVLITSVETAPEVMHAFKQAGADGFVAKNRSKHLIREAIRTVSSGGKWFESPSESGPPSEAPRPPLTPQAARESLEAITPREKEVLRLRAEGLDPKEIAARLKLRSAGDVNNRMLRIRERVGAATTTDACQIWLLAQELPGSSEPVKAAIVQG